MTKICTVMLWVSWRILLLSTVLVMTCSPPAAAVTTTSHNHHNNHNMPSRNADYDYDRLLPDHLQPVLTSAPVQVARAPGQTVTMDCKVQQLGNHSLTWRRGTQIIAVMTGGHQQRVNKDPRYLASNANLTIFNVVPEDSGNFTCEVASRPSPLSLSHVLHVYEPPRILMSRNRLTPREGSTITLECPVRGYPPPTVTWRRKYPNNTFGPFLYENNNSEGEDYSTDTSTSSSSVSSVHSSNALVLSNLSRTDAGKYLCTATNSRGQPVYATVTLHVMFAPVISVPQPLVHGGVGSVVELVCQVAAYPVAKVTWHREDNDAPVNPMRLSRGRRDGERFSLHFKPLLRQDFGGYRCEANNQLGQASAVVSITGIPKPPIVVSESHGNFTSQYTLQWEVVSYASILHYVLNIRNATDPIEDSINITVPGYGSSFSNYHSQKKELTALQPDTLYVVDIAAYNEFGYSTLLFPFTFQTAAEDHLLLPSHDYDEDYFGAGADYHDHHDYDDDDSAHGGLGPGPRLQEPSENGSDYDHGDHYQGDHDHQNQQQHHRHRHQQQHHQQEHRVRHHDKHGRNEWVEQQLHTESRGPLKQTGGPYSPTLETELDQPYTETLHDNSSLPDGSTASPAPPSPSYPGWGAWLTAIILSAFFC